MTHGGITVAIEYGVFVVDGLSVQKQSLSLSGQTTGITDAQGLMGVPPLTGTLVRSLARVGADGWSLTATYPNNANQTYVLIFSRQQ